MNILKELFYKYIEIYMYLIIGVLTTLISFIVYGVLVYFNAEVETANIISNIISIIFAFIANSLFVFNFKFTNLKLTLIKFFQFSFFRIILMLLETGLLWLLVKNIGFDKYICKFATTCLIVALNYILSKFVIYKKEK